MTATTTTLPRPKPAALVPQCCGRCYGTGRVEPAGEWVWYECRDCRGTGTVYVPRPGDDERRVMP